MTGEWDSEAYAMLSHVAGIESTEEQKAYLDEACAGNPALRERVERLLSVYQQAGSFLDSPAIPASEANVGSPQYDRLGAQIGAYKILQEIGEGGFGVVYMAEQQRPVRRKVALKIIKPGMDSREVIARFEAEQQALAMMDHPNITRVLDAGTTDSGRPYFAMELVKGVPITEYCDKNNMPLPERLRLFVTVCRAVQHAHQKAVIHRDLKPSNIMVTLHDGKPVPKVIDFGVAKALNHQLTEKTLFTHYGQMIGTPQYMSPEQAEMSGLDVDTRSDIYSLGVLLYEMLTGSTPLTAEQLRATGFAEIQRVIREDEPPTPSTRLSTLGDQLTIIASHRQSHPSKLRQQLHGELDWIVMKSLDKDRARRYETASAFASDIEAYLKDEPVQARPPSVGYLLGKTFRKHRRLVVTSVLFAIILLAATAISVWQAIRAKEQSLIANEARVRAVVNANIAKTETLRAEQARGQMETLKEVERRKGYLSEMHLASIAYDEGHLHKMNEYLVNHVPKSGTDDLRGFDWYHWWQAGHLHQDRIDSIQPFFDLTSAPNGEFVAAHVWRSRIRLYRSDDLSLVAEVPGTGPPALSPDNTVLAAQDPNIRDIRIWSTADFAHVQTLDAEHERELNAMVFSPTQPSMLAAADEAGVISVWNASNWDLIKRLTLHVPVRGLAFAAGGKALVASMNSGQAVVFDVANWEEKAISKTLRVAVGSGPEGPRASQLVSTSSGDLLAAVTRSGTIQLWNKDLQLGESIPLSTAVWSMAFSPDGTRLAAGTMGSNSVLVWDVSSRPVELVARIRGHDRTVRGVAFVGGSDTIWSASTDSSIKIWNLAKCQPFHEFRIKSARGSRVAYSPNGMLTIIRDGGVVRRWNIKKREWVANWNCGPYESVAVSGDGSVLAGVADGELEIWDLNDPPENDTPESRFPVPIDSSRPLGPRSVRTWPTRIAVARSGTTVAWGSPLKDDELNTETVVFDTRTKSEICRIAPGLEGSNFGRKHWPVFSPNGKRLAVQHYDQVEIWDISARTPSLRCYSQGWGGRLSMAFSPDEETLAIADGSHSIRLVDAETGRPLHKLIGHDGDAISVAFARDGSFLLSGGEDRTVRMWDVKSGKLRSTFNGHEAAVIFVAVSPAGDTIASLSEDGTARIWTKATDRDVENDVDYLLDEIDTIGFQQGWEEALGVLDSAVTNNQRSWKLLARRSDIHRRLRNWGEAINDYSAAIELRPNDVLLFKQRAEMYIRGGQRARARDDLEKAFGLSTLLHTQKHVEQIRRLLRLGKEIVPESAQWRYITPRDVLTEGRPSADWNQAAFDDSQWRTGRAPFGRDESFLGFSFDHLCNTSWWDDDIWLRHTFGVEIIGEPLVLSVYVNDEAEIYINGELAARVTAKSDWWEGVMDVAGKVKLKKHQNVLAVHCRNANRKGNGKIDVGLYVSADKDEAIESLVKAALE